MENNPKTIKLPNVEQNSVERMKIAEKIIMQSMGKINHEAGKKKLGEITVYEVMKVLSKVQHHYSGVGVEFQWEDAIRHNEETLANSQKPEDITPTGKA